MTANLKVVELPRTAMHDIPATLRWLAGEVESGKYQASKELVVVVQTEAGTEVFGMGEANVGAARLLLGAAALKLDRAVLEGGA